MWITSLSMWHNVNQFKRPILRPENTSQAPSRRNLCMKQRFVWINETILRKGVSKGVHEWSRKLVFQTCIWMCFCVYFLQISFLNWFAHLQINSFGILVQKCFEISTHHFFWFNAFTFHIKFANKCNKMKPQTDEVTISSGWNCEIRAFESFHDIFILKGRKDDVKQ